VVEGTEGMSEHEGAEGPEHEDGEHAVGAEEVEDEHRLESVAHVKDGEVVGSQELDRVVGVQVGMPMVELVPRVVVGKLRMAAGIFLGLPCPQEELEEGAVVVGMDHEESVVQGQELDKHRLEFLEDKHQGFQEQHVLGILEGKHNLVAEAGLVEDEAEQFPEGT